MPGRTSVRFKMQPDGLVTAATTPLKAAVRQKLVI